MSKILIVEDEYYLAELYKMKFEHEGYEVIWAPDGEAGLDMAMKDHPDLVLLDIIMPKLNGYEVLKALRSHEVTKNLKVFMLSNLGQSDEIKDALDKGADGYFIKANLTPGQLCDNVHKILSGETLQGKRGMIIKREEKETQRKEDRGISVLLIEDQEEIINMYKMRLESDGFNVTIAKNGAWGLKMSKEKKFDIIIMDVLMPAMNGVEMLKEIKKESANMDVPIVVVSNSAQDQDISDAKSAGATSFLLKSQITPGKLIKEIEKQLTK